MRGTVKPTLAVLATAAVLTAGGNLAWAQQEAPPAPLPEATVEPLPEAIVETPGETLVTLEGLTLEGYCPVCIIELGKWIQGVPEHKTVFDGRTYQIPGEKQKEMFLADPLKYVPVLGGDCIVSLVKWGKRVPGLIHHGVQHQGRTFLFANEEAKEMFVSDPAAFENADLAYGGNCAVCQVAMNVTTPGKWEFGAIHEGLRYFFPSAKMRDIFLADPQKFEVGALVEEKENDKENDKENEKENAPAAPGSDTR